VKIREPARGVIISEFTGGECSFKISLRNSERRNAEFWLNLNLEVAL
jgi:hypothetical protein